MKIKMCKIQLIGAFVVLFSLFGYSQSDLEIWLDQQSPLLTYTKLDTNSLGYQQYEVYITQPVDHTKRGGPTFNQKIYLTHSGFKQPTVIGTQGYNVTNRRSEVADILHGNYINVEHRYFATSTPEPKDWQYLTLEQATADLHAINQLFRQIYKDKWVASGISKGGQTSIYYRYFYPDDVDVSVPYVAPFNYSMEDKRIYHFLDTISTAECRKKVFEVQKYLLKNKMKAIDRLQWFAKGKSLTFDYLGSFEAAFEYAVLEYPFSVWQWGTACEDIPTDKNLDTYMQHLLDVVGFDFYSDASMTFFAPHYYQASDQMGYYGYESKRYSRWLDKLGKNPTASFPPTGTNPTFDDSLIKKVDKWLEKDANNILYINGLMDTWSATRVIPSKKVNSKAYNLPDADHGHARIVYMSPEMQADFVATLEEMLNRKVDIDVIMKK